MPLPSAATKANCDASTDDPKLALLTDLAGLVDTVNALITAVGAEYAPLASPSLTGNPTAPTQALRNNTTRLASTAFVLANQVLNGVLSKSGAYTVLAADYGKLVNATSGTWNLSVDPALGAGPVCAVRNSGSGTITVVPTTGTIDGAASIDIDAGVSCIVESDGTDLFTVGRTAGMASAWVDVKTSPGRVKNVTYTNGYDRDLDVLITQADGSGGLTFYVDSVLVAAAGSGATAANHIISVRVPPGSDYLLGNTGGALAYWFEK